MEKVKGKFVGRGILLSSLIIKDFPCLAGLVEVFEYFSSPSEYFSDSPGVFYFI